jgi:hypothetical protein
MAGTLGDPAASGDVARALKRRSLALKNVAHRATKVLRQNEVVARSDMTNLLKTNASGINSKLSY